jgi:hypothetical protein
MRMCPSHFVGFELVRELIHAIQVNARLDAEGVRLDRESRRPRRLATEPEAASKRVVDRHLQAPARAASLLLERFGHIGIESSS